MVAKSRLIPAISFLVLVSLGCGLTFNTGLPSPQPTTNEINTAVVRSLTETSLAQTVVAISVAQTSNAGQPNTQPVLPSLTPSITLTGTPDRVFLTVSQATNCREGPGAVYDWKGVLEPGVTAEVIARDPYGLDWYIRNPNNPNDFCWIFGQFATLTGNYAALPAFTAIPSPTPTFTPTLPPTDFSVSSIGVVHCLPFGEWYINIVILNSGSNIWQSWKLSLTDTTAGGTTITDWDKFGIMTTLCVTSNIQEDLSPGESGGVFLIPLLYNPAGHLFTGTLRLCSLNGLLGTCVSKAMNFTP